MARKRNKKSLSLVSKSCAVGLVCQTALSPALSAAASRSSLRTVSPTEVPTLKSGGKLTGATVDASKSASGSLTINQSQSKAIIDWQTFNIGSQGSVTFNQKLNGVGQKSWSALNRIYDANPSQIYGKLTADGQIFLINQNGILFGQGAQVNVGALFASTMNIRDKDFLAGTLRFTSENYQDSAYVSPMTYETYLEQNPSATRSQYLSYYDGVVAQNLLLTLPDSTAFVNNEGTITTSVGGAAYLIGPTVENSGTISTPTGVTSLIAGTRGSNVGSYDLLVTDTRDTDALTNPQTVLKLNESFQGGEAVNAATGTIRADRGQVGMYGRLVRQNGVIRAVTSVKKGGKIELLASEKIVTGAGSSTSTPIDTSSDTADSTFDKKSGSVILAGLTVTNSDLTTSYAPPALIEHRGAIEAHSGSVVMEASDRIFLDSGSSIDVSGLWVDREATDILINPQLNSVNLRDDFGQKNGELLGEYVWVDSRTGTTLADVSGYYDLVELTAMERNTTGGSIAIGSHSLSAGNNTISDGLTTSEVVVKDGASLNFSGGGYRYAAGYIPVTRLVSGNGVYDISTASQWLTYSGILTSYRYSSAFTEGHDAGSLAIEARQTALNGTLSGGATRGVYQTRSAELTDSYGNQMTQGLVEPLGGTLTIGSSAKTVTTSDDVNAGRADYITSAIAVTGESIALDGDFTVDSELPEEWEGVSYLSADVINAAGLGELNLNANGTVRIEATSHLSLASNAGVTKLNIRGRQIVVSGTIDAPGWDVSLTGVNNLTSYENDVDNSALNASYVALTERIFVADGARISVAGDQIDNSGLAHSDGSSTLFGHTAGGTITLDSYSYNSDGVFIQDGSLLDVSSGWSISSSGTVTGGNAGTLSLSGPNLLLDGTVRGLALLGSTGGKISLTSEKITVADESLSLPDGFTVETGLDESLKQGLVLAGDRLDQSGFSRLELNSFGDALVQEGVTLSPSLAVLSQPTAGGSGTGTAFVIADADDVSSTSIKIVAGSTRLDGQVTREYMERFPSLAGYIYEPSRFPHTDYAALLSVAKGAEIRVAPGGSISLKGPGAEIDGTLSARAGAISVTVKTDTSDSITFPSSAGSGTLTIGATAVLDVSGYNKEKDGLIGGLPAGYTALDAGSITLSATADGEATRGDIVVEEGARLDLSGSEQAMSAYRLTNGSRATATVAGAAGSLNLTYLHGLSLEGDIDASSHLSGIKGGSLSISRTDLDNGLSLTGAALDAYQQAGFDAFTFQSRNSISFTGNVDIRAGRTLTLDAPRIDGSGATSVSLYAPWLTLTNSYYPDDDLDSPASGSASLSVAGEYIDVTGAVSLSGFDKVTLAAGEDIRLTDLYYSVGGKTPVPQAGRLALAGDLTMSAAAIYPTSQSVFTISAGGSIATRAGDHDNTGSIYSALGNLTLVAGEGIDHQGYLAAPMGQLTLDAGNGRLYLGKGSILTTSTDLDVTVGALNEDGVWMRHDRSSAPLDAGVELTTTNSITVTSAPESSITLTGAEVVSADGATIDASGGGSISAYQFISDLQGSVNPISVTGISGSSVVRSNRFVILADNSVSIPGYTSTYVGTDGSQKSITLQAIYLEGCTLSDGTVLKAGTYSILPESFAFLPGAVIVSSTGSAIASGTQLTSKEGYDVVAGYTTALGTSLTSSVMTGYTVRSASDVLQEGHFETSRLVSGNGGNLSITADSSALIGGTIRLAAASGDYSGGTVAINGANVLLASSGDLFAGFSPSYESELPDSLQGKVAISADSLNGQGIRSLRVGDSETVTTDSVTVQEEVELAIPEISLIADDSITLEKGAQLIAVAGDGGDLNISAAAVTLEENSLAHAGGDLDLRATTLSLDGELRVDNGTLGLSSTSIAIAGDNQQRSTGGLYLDADLLTKLASISSLAFISDSDLTFYGAVNLSPEKALTIDAARVTGTGDVKLAASVITLKNSGKDSADFSGGAPSLADTLSADGGQLSLEADRITVSAGNADDTSYRFDNTRTALWNVLLDGFSDVKLASSGDLTLQGVGTLKTAADLELSAARITTGVYADDTISYKSSRVTLDAGTGDVTINKSGGEAGTTTTSGGSLEIRGGKITDNGVIELPSGSLTLAATNGVTLGSDARILARGSKARTQASDAAGEYAYVYTSAGDVTINGATVELKDGSLIDVSANGKGDAGSIAISGSGGVFLAGTLKGAKGSGSSDLGGSFSLDTASLSDLDSLVIKLATGGFDEQVSLRARSKDLTLGETTTLKAHAISLAADGGNIGINGTLDASGTTAGGTIDLAANGDLALAGTAKLLAKGSETGGEVTLKAGTVDDDGKPTGTLTVAKGASIDVSGADDASGGTVRFRAMRNAAGDDLLLTFSETNLNDTVKGASLITAEATRVYSLDSEPSLELADTLDAADGFISSSGGAITSRILGGENNDAFRLLAGVEVRSSGDIVLSGLTGNNNLDLTSRETGVLTLRAGGDLTIDVNLLDHPTTDNAALSSGTVLPSWDINMVAGAATGAADRMAVNANGSGDLSVAKEVMVYSESGSVSFASAGDTTLNRAYTGTGILFNDMFNSLGSFSGAVRGHVGGDLVLNGGVIQTATGDIDLTVGGDVRLDYDSTTGYGTIRTTGEPSDTVQFPTVVVDGEEVAFLDARLETWNYRNGGDITLKAGGSVTGAWQATDAWDAATVASYDTENYGFDLSFKGWSAKYNKADGDITSFNATADADSFTQGIATMAGGSVTVTSGGDVASQVGTFGEGNLTVYARGDIFGRYLVSGTEISPGSGKLLAMGNIGLTGASASYRQPVIELRYVEELTATAFGSMSLGTILNPTLDDRFGGWFPTYSTDGRVSLTSLGGDVTLLGTMFTRPTYSAPVGSANLASTIILPSSLYVSAAGDFSLHQDLVLAPSEDGQLAIYAGGDVAGSSETSWRSILMSDMTEASFFVSADKVPDYAVLHGTSTGGVNALHAKDALAAVIVADGDISNLQISLPKQATIAAGEDLSNLYISTQNQTAGDLTSISAGGDILFTRNQRSSSADSGIEHAGPGTLLVSAGGSIDLGYSNGIRAVGDSYNSYLSSDGSDLLLLAGVSKSTSLSDAVALFDALRAAGDEYNDLLGDGEKERAEETIAEAREELITPLFADAAEGSGTIDMVSSKISTVSENADIYIVAGGVINVGRSSLTTDSDTSTGIFTAKGGDINILSIGDLNVNQSRVMTYFGGDITLWSDQGDINAGRGSKTSVNASAPQLVMVDPSDETKGYRVVFTPPAVGSGIRALTYDPNTTPGGDLVTPEPGDISLYTPQGTIDAGEAGIAGGKITLIANEVLNVTNISFSAGSVGVPSSSGSVSVGSFSGNSSLTDSSKMIEQSSGAGAARDSLKSTTQTLDDFMSRFLDVKVIGFDVDEDADEKEKGRKR